MADLPRLPASRLHFFRWAGGTYRLLSGRICPAAQALPGPLFTLSAFTGTVASGGWQGGIIALLAIFLPGMLLVIALLPIWHRYRQNRWAGAGLMGINASVVGLLLAALIHPVWSNGIQNWSDFAVALLAFVALQRYKCPAWAVVLTCGAVGVIL